MSDEPLSALSTPKRLAALSRAMKLAALNTAKKLVALAQVNNYPSWRYLFADIITVTDAFTASFVGTPVHDSVTMSDQTTASGTFTKAEVVTLSDVLTILGAMLFNDQATITDAFTSKGLYTAADSATMTDAFVSKGLFTKAEAVAMTDAISIAYQTGMGDGARPGEFWPGAALLGASPMG
jgi:hypothetical protein